jgi:hypothetical protein
MNENNENNKSVLAPLPETKPVPEQPRTTIVNEPEPNSGPMVKDMLIGTGILVLLMVLFFFIRNAFVNFLVGPSMRRSPDSAGLAGWGLFGGLFFGALLGCIALISREYLTVLLIVPICLLSLICFALALFVTIKK